jgi:hypothetical protein
MRGPHLLLAFSWLTVLGPPGRAADYTAIDRTIKAEPKYDSKSPKYTLLVFGREAKLRVWLVLDGKTLHLDRNADGDLTGKDERFARADDCKDVEIADPDGKTRYVITGVGEYEAGELAKPRLMVSVSIKGPLSYSQYGDAGPADGPRTASVMHFHGPLTAGPVTVNWKVPPGLALAVGEKPTDLRAVVGTMSAEHGCWVVVRSHNGDKSAFPDGVHPAVDIEFPSKAPGGQAVKKRYTLHQFC